MTMLTCWCCSAFGAGGCTSGADGSIHAWPWTPVMGSSSEWSHRRARMFFDLACPKICCRPQSEKRVLNRHSAATPASTANAALVPATAAEVRQRWRLHIHVVSTYTLPRDCAALQCRNPWPPSRGVTSFASVNGQSGCVTVSNRRHCCARTRATEQPAQRIDRGMPLPSHWCVAGRRNAGVAACWYRHHRANSAVPHPVPACQVDDAAAHALPRPAYGTDTSRTHPHSSLPPNKQQRWRDNSSPAVNMGRLPAPN